MEPDVEEQSISHAAVSLSAIPSLKKAEVEDSDVSSIDEQDDSLIRPVRKKRPNRRYAEWSSDDEYCLRALKRSNIKYKEPDSSSESESEFIRPTRDSALKPTGLPIGVVRGCPKCNDCQAVLARWRPEEGRKPSVDEAPVFYPTEEEFKDTLKYIAKIRPSAEPFGICRVVPPKGWRPPCPLRDDIAKLHVLRFPTRVQEIHKLQVRQAVKKCSQARNRLGGRRGRGGFRGRMGRPCRRTPNLTTNGSPAKAVGPDESFGFEPGSYFSLSMFEKYAQQFKEQYFVAGKGGNELQAESESKRDSASNMNPSVDAIEAEYWRIVEKPTEQIEVLYGADVETGRFGSGFPKAKAGEILTDTNAYEKSGWNLNNVARLPGSMLAFEEGDISGVLVPWLYVGMCFSSFCWDDLARSAFGKKTINVSHGLSLMCLVRLQHVEDHHFYSLNYMHWGAPKVWYGVAGHAAHDVEAVMKKNLPELFEEQPDLLHKLVTQLSPTILKEEGLPVYRLVQHAGEFVITFPRAYHSGFNCGFNCAEAVNVAPVDWLPHGQSAVELYMQQRRKTSVSHDKLLLAAAREAVKGLLQSQQGSMQPQGQAVKQEVKKEWDIPSVHGGAKDISYAWRDLCGPDGVLVKALKARVRLEQSRRASLSGELRMKRMDRCYDATDERECAECHYDLHLSAVGCDCCPDKYVCLSHALLLCGCQWGRKFVMYRHEMVNLEVLVEALEGQLWAMRSWLELENAASSAANVSTPSSSSQPGFGGNVGPCEFNSTEFQFDRTGFEGQTLESKPAVGITTRSKISGWSDHLTQWIKTSPTVPVEHSLVANVNKSGQAAQPMFYTGVGVDAKEMNTVGMQIRGPSEIQGLLEKMEKKIDQLPSSRKEVIVLSDDEEGTLTRSRSAISSLTKVHEGNNVGLRNSSNNMAALDSGRGVTGTGRVTKLMDAGVTDILQRAPDLPNATLAGATLGRATLQRGMSVPISSTQLPSIILTPPLTAHTQSFVSSVGERPVVASPLTRPKSIGSLKQQARAGSAQHLASGLRQVGSRVDHLQRLQNSQEVSGAELCGHVPTPDTTPSSFTQCGNVQSRTPARVDRTAGPRMAKVLRRKGNCEIELINVGSLVHRDGWLTKYCIFPAGFKSRTIFCSVLNISQTCSYVSEIVECGQAGPRFKVSVEGNSTAVFVDDSIDGCWQAVQERINEEIIRRRGCGETNLPSLQPPQSLHGLEMFGFTSATIVQAIEALDPQQKCSEYWNAKLRHTPLVGHPPPHAVEHHPTTSDDPHFLGPKENGANVEFISRPTTPTTGTLSRRVPVEYPSKGTVDLYGVLKGFFQRGKADELWALHRLFSSEWQGKEWREGFQALTDVLDTGHPP